jgi:hypothetical protein
LIGIAGDIVAVLTVTGLSIYVIGLVGLAMAIRLRLIEDTTTAWYVVSLLPRTVVAGQGVKIWLLWPLPFAVVLVVVDKSVVALTKSREFAREILELTSPTLGFVFLSIFLMRVLYEMHKLAATHPAGEPMHREPIHPDLIGHFILATIIALLGTLLMAKGALLIVRVLHEDSLPLLGIPLEGMISGTVLFIVGGFFVGICMAATVAHPLPRVQITELDTVESKGLLDLPKGDKGELYLVAHTDGYWHFVYDESNELFSIPDRCVPAVRVRADTMSTEKAALTKGNALAEDMKPGMGKDSNLPSVRSEADKD